MQRDQRIDGERVQRRFVSALGEQLRIGVVAEILDQQKPPGRGPRRRFPAR
jgi:hypothetical protein